MNIYAPKKPKRINSVSVTVTLLVIGFGYFLWAFLPIYWPIFQLQGIARAACNDAYRQLDNDMVIQKLVENSRRTGLQLTQENFRMRRIPYPEEELARELATIDDPRRRLQHRQYLRKRGKTCVIEYYYRDDYALPVIGQSIQLTFNDEVQGSLESVRW